MDLYKELYKKDAGIDLNLLFTELNAVSKAFEVAKEHGNNGMQNIIAWRFKKLTDFLYNNKKIDTYLYIDKKGYEKVFNK